MGKLTPLVSVIITTRNRAGLLGRALQSVKEQTYQNYELIVVDDASTDHTESVARAFGGGRYMKLEENLGSSAARNYGFKKSKGHFVVFLDDDNEFLPDFLKETVYLLATSSNEAGGVRVGRIVKQKGFDDYAPPITHTGFDSIDWGVLLKRRVLEKIKYDLDCYADEDADFGIRFAQEFKMIPLDKPLQVAHAEEDVASMCAPSPRRLKGLEYFIGKHLALYKKHPNELRYLYRLAGRNFYKAGYTLKGLWYFWLSFLAQNSWQTWQHFWYVLQGWDTYDRFMDREERQGAILRMQSHGLQ